VFAVLNIPCKQKTSKQKLGSFARSSL